MATRRRRVERKPKDEPKPKKVKAAPEKKSPESPQTAKDSAKETKCLHELKVILDGFAAAEKYITKVSGTVDQEDLNKIAEANKLIVKGI